MKPGDRFLALDLTCGGHLSHGFKTPKRNVSHTSLFWDTDSYRIDENGYINYDECAEKALAFKPKILVAGYSAYPRDLDYKRFREIADSVGAKLMVDMAHFSGLVAGGVLDSPFEYADIVTSTTHKSLRGPRGGLIFCKKELGQAIDDSLFPGLQGGPHNQSIGGLATALNDVLKPEHKEYSELIVENSKALASSLMDKGYKLVTDGTDNHIVLWNVRAAGVTGSKFEEISNYTNITLNKNTIAGDKSAANPGGVRLGTPACTTRGYLPEDMNTVADFLDRNMQIALSIQAQHGKKLVDFRKGIPGNSDIIALSKEVEEFATQFDVPGL